MPDAATPPPRRVTVIALGGTIAMTASSGGGVVPTLSAADLLATVPGLDATGIAADVIDFRRTPAASLGFGDLDELLDLIDDIDADGFVITQGTDTIEETSFFLDLRHTGDAPIVVTGAMRDPTMPGPDGPANLDAALRTAASAEARGLGVLVVFADEIHAAARVRKVHTTSVMAFASPNGGPLGHVVEGRPRLLARPARRITVPRGRREVRVPLVTACLGDDTTVLDALAANPGLDGLVVAATGAGHVPVAYVPVLEKLAARVPVVLASRTGAGATLTGTYGFPGSERDLIARGLIPAGFLDALKARLLLHALLASGGDRDAIAAAFAAH